MVPGCGLDEAGRGLQRERYEHVGVGASVVERSPRSLVVDLDERVDPGLVEDVLAVERDCCSFFDLRWEPTTRRLAFSVSSREYEPALDAIAFALGVEPT